MEGEHQHLSNRLSMAPEEHFLKTKCSSFFQPQSLELIYFFIFFLNFFCYNRA